MPKCLNYQYTTMKLASKKDSPSSEFQDPDKKREPAEEKESQKARKLSPMLYASVGGGILGKVYGDKIPSSIIEDYGGKAIGNNGIPITRPPSVKKQYRRTYELVKHLGYEPRTSPPGLAGPLVFVKKPTETDTAKAITLDLSSAWADPATGRASNSMRYGEKPMDLDTIWLGSGNSGRIGSLAHELGHVTQSTKLRKYMQIGGNLNKATLPYAILAGTLRSRDPKVQEIMDTVGLGIAGAGTLGGIAQLAGELHASYRGHKLIRDSGILNKIPKGLRNTSKPSLSTALGPYMGIPTYALQAAAPAIGYYAARYLPEKIENLYYRLKNRKAQGTQGTQGAQGTQVSKGE